MKLKKPQGREEFIVAQGSDNWAWERDSAILL